MSQLFKVEQSIFGCKVCAFPNKLVKRIRTIQREKTTAESQIFLFIILTINFPSYIIVFTYIQNKKNHFIIVI